MNTRILIILSLLAGIGAVLHAVIPPILFGMKPDMSLAMMFLGIVMFPKLRYVILLSIVTGFISALTTSFPLGQIPNIIEKPITGLIFFGLFLLVRNVMKRSISTPILTVIGTIVSGSLFLSMALYIFSVDIGVGFIALFAANVLPATVVNTIAMIVIYPMVQAIMKRSQPIPMA